ncbi:Enoyl-[acyl-carrier-protein] reductase [Actinomyces sp. Chiba101]|uniref:SDR family oxidoreductase n=1 Tax=Actinomyces TaxID=1654 RepID=UPI000974DE89|nr:MULTISPECIES: SDR family oxidoreductase [Actinomyces]BAW92937.1 Enoyl-[acyl-carrier-protein] reductase [Actinomyces sp. Chiba101]GAV94081.1 enoyl-[acyl-carrier-protein] reductase [Actinomyces denticolens]SUU06099.1 Enoyl-[acyl-carrier-protein] reductase [NADH] [Actinomyces denticolens]
MNPSPGAPPGLLRGRTILITGVMRPSSIAASVTRVAAEQGARVILTAHPRARVLAESVAAAQGLAEPVVGLDVADPASLAALPGELERLGVVRLDGVVHSIARAGRDLLGTVLPAGAEEADDGERMRARLEEAGEARMAALRDAFIVSAASLPALVEATAPLLDRGSSVLALTFDTSRVYPGYGWMGPLKAALEASVRSLAVELGLRGVRVNALSAGPLRTTAASAIPAFDDLVGDWGAGAPLGWDPDDAAPVARTAVALLSDWMPATTGAVIHADGGATLS